MKLAIRRIVRIALRPLNDNGLGLGRLVTGTCVGIFYDGRDGLELGLDGGKQQDSCQPIVNHGRLVQHGG